jgi:manganese transport protein
MATARTELRAWLIRILTPRISRQVISQVILSIALPLPMISLLIFTRRADIMGRFANSPLTQTAAVTGTASVLLLNLFLILQTCGVPIPGLATGG